MVSAADREKARRLEVERAFVKPEPVHEWANAAPTDRPSRTVDSIVAAARGLGWVVEEKTRYDWHPPAWVTDPDGGPARYECKRRVQYSLFVHHPKGADYDGGPSGLAGVLLNLVDGKKFGNIQTGYARNYQWVPRSDLAVSSVAKLIREEGIKA